MPGMVNLPSAREAAAYAVPDGPCSAATRAPSRGEPEESVTTPAIAAVVTPWAPSAVVPANASVATRTQGLNDRTNVFITSLQREAIATAWSGRGKCAPPPKGRQATLGGGGVDAPANRRHRTYAGIPARITPTSSQNRSGSEARTMPIRDSAPRRKGAGPTGQ